MIIGGFYPGSYFPIGTATVTPEAPCEPWTAVGATTGAWAGVGATSYGWLPLTVFRQHCDSPSDGSLEPPEEAPSIVAGGISGVVLQTDDFTTPTTGPATLAHTIELRDVDQTILSTTTCDTVTGEYSFPDLLPGTYYLSFLMVLGVDRHLVAPNISTPGAFADGIWDNGSDPTETLYWNTVTLTDTAVTDVGFTVWIHAN